MPAERRELSSPGIRVQAHQVPGNLDTRPFTYRVTGMDEVSGDFQDGCLSVVGSLGYVNGIITPDRKIAWSTEVPSHSTLYKLFGAENRPSTLKVESTLAHKLRVTLMCTNIDDALEFYCFLLRNLTDDETYLALDVYRRGWTGEYRGNLIDYKPPLLTLN